MVRLRNLPPRIALQDMRIARPAPKTADPFYASTEWRSLVRQLIEVRGRRCEDCQRTHAADGFPVRIFGDHVRELRDGGAPLDGANVKLLCGACHADKTATARAARMGASRPRATPGRGG